MNGIDARLMCAVVVTVTRVCQLIRLGVMRGAQLVVKVDDDMYVWQ